MSSSPSPLVTHAVLVEIPDDAAPDVAERIVELFGRFPESIPGVLEVRVGLDFSGRCAPYTILAVLSLESRKALSVYAVHPAHKELIALLDRLGSRRIVADIEQ